MLRQAKLSLAAPILVIGALLISGAFSYGTETTVRPKGPASAPTKSLRQAQVLIQKGEREDASDLLESLTPSSLLEESWIDYLKGVLFQKDSNDAAAITTFSHPYTLVKENPGTKPDPSLFRLVGLCLKKLAGFYKKAGDRDKAYFYHQLAYEYFLKWGSAEEVHDATLSLDGDSYAAGDFVLDEVWIRRGIEVTKEIDGEADRRRALGMSWTNLAGTLTRVNRFGEAVGAIEKSLGYWEKYEKAAGPAENQLVSAYFGVGNIYIEWAKALKAQNDGHYREKLQKAQSAFSKSLEIAEERSLPQQQILPIQDKLKAIREAGGR